jgi:hypothetical protein
LDDRALISSLLQNSDIFPQNLLYRPDDPNFGVATKVVYYHAYGLDAATLDDYVNAVQLNHYNKTLTLGRIETAQALNPDGTVKYEIVYSRIVDDLVNNQGVSVGKQVQIPYAVDVDGTIVETVYPNSLYNMRTQVIDSVGQVSNILPGWMTSKQADGSVLGFIPAWVIAYTEPGKSGQVAYNIQTQFGTKLNLIDYNVDRYEVDRLLSKNWDPVTQEWIPTPPSVTTFDYELVLPDNNWINDDGYAVTWINDFFEAVVWTPNYTGSPTTFDGNSLQFIVPVDMYSNTQAYDKYVVFPKRNILG